MYHGVFTLLPFLSISGLRVILPIPYRFGLQQSLYAHVQVCSHPHPLGLGSLMIWKSSLVTGSTSHKLVTSDVSRILWRYYNDSVG